VNINGTFNSGDMPDCEGGVRSCLGPALHAPINHIEKFNNELGFFAADSLSRQVIEGIKQ